VSAPDAGAPMPEQIKACCVDLYQHDLVRLIVGDHLHPGGPELTRHLADMVELAPGERVLDVASGTGASALLLAKELGVEVLGVDLAPALVGTAQRAARASGAGDQVHFRLGDAERLDVGDASFDAAICECALCTFPDRRAALAGLATALRPGGRLGLADVTVDPDRGVPAELDDVLGTVACVAGAQPVDGYVTLLREAGFASVDVERRDDAALRLIERIRSRMELLRSAVGHLVDLERALTLVDVASEAVRDGRLGYALFAASKPGPRES
jgi:arsenite methyltransferase